SVTGLGVRTEIEAADASQGTIHPVNTSGPAWGTDGAEIPSLARSGSDTATSEKRSNASFPQFCEPIDVSTPTWSWDAVAKQTQDALKTHGIPQWLGCLVGKTHIPSSQV